MSAPCTEVYARLALALMQGDKATARQIYYDEILPNRRFSRDEVVRLSYRLGVIDEGDQYLASGPDLAPVAPAVAARELARGVVRAGAPVRAAAVANGHAAPTTREVGVPFDRRNHVERVEAMLIPGEAIDAVFDTKGGCTGFVGITDRRVIIHDRAFLHRHQATVSIPYSRISCVAAKDEPGWSTGRGCWASRELILTTSAGDFELGFRAAEKAHRAHCLILQHLI